MDINGAEGLKRSETGKEAVEQFRADTALDEGVYIT